jgi:hypothetical protein
MASSGNGDYTFYIINNSDWEATVTCSMYPSYTVPAGHGTLLYNGPGETQAVRGVLLGTYDEPDGSVSYTWDLTVPARGRTSRPGRTTVS